MYIAFIATISFLGFFIASGGVAHAVPPPDFIFSVGTQVVQAFSFILIISSAMFSTVYAFTRHYFSRIKNKKFVGIVIGCMLVALAIAGSGWYGKYTRDVVYQDWLKHTSEQPVITTVEVDATKAPEVKDSTEPAPDPEPSSSFFEQNESLSLAISNKEFSSQGDGAFVLDAREDEEHEYGTYPGSMHIRFADIVDGKWEDLPKDRVITIICWSGIRGSEVAKFLRSKNIVARYLDNGASSWVKDGGAWQGEITFIVAHPEDRFQLVLSTNKVKDYVAAGALLIDSRPQDKYKSSKIKNSVNIPVIYTPSSKMPTALAQVPKGSTVITICDDFVSCFDAKLAGLKLERNGNTFIGRYTTPWEY